ncbi:MAG: acetyl-coenzyme A synthetase, partial [Candidatus Marinimicrobia bacterium]|nr:acetyl-coenzyme A synthetase [Candidatus Neomarinimicrobiota bacterium]
MSEVKKFNPAAEFTANAHIKSMEQYQEMYDRSVNDEDGFWAEQAERLTWFKKWDTVANYDLATADIKWYEGGKLNVSYNCLDRHVE